MRRDESGIFLRPLIYLQSSEPMITQVQLVRLKIHNMNAEDYHNP